LIDFGRFRTISEKIPEAGLFQIAMLRGGVLFSTQRDEDAKTREGKSVRFSGFSFP
jgi:hypothetical protein